MDVTPVFQKRKLCRVGTSRVKLKPHPGLLPGLEVLCWLPTCLGSQSTFQNMLCVNWIPVEGATGTLQVCVLGGGGGVLFCPFQRGVGEWQCECRLSLALIFPQPSWQKPEPQRSSHPTPLLPSASRFPPRTPTLSIADHPLLARSLNSSGWWPTACPAIQTTSSLAKPVYFSALWWPEPHFSSSLPFLGFFSLSPSMLYSFIIVITYTNIFLFNLLYDFSIRLAPDCYRPIL